MPAHVPLDGGYLVAIVPGRNLIALQLLWSQVEHSDTGPQQGKNGRLLAPAPGETEDLPAVHVAHHHSVDGAIAERLGERGSPAFSGGAERRYIQVEPRPGVALAFLYPLRSARRLTLAMSSKSRMTPSCFTYEPRLRACRAMWFVRSTFQAAIDAHSAKATCPEHGPLAR